MLLAPLVPFEAKAAYTMAIGNGAQLAIGCRPDDGLFVTLTFPNQQPYWFPDHPVNELHVLVGGREVWSDTEMWNTGNAERIGMVTGSRVDGIVNNLLRQLITAEDQPVSLKFSGIFRWQVLAEPWGDTHLRLDQVQMLRQVCTSIDVGHD